MDQMPFPLFQQMILKHQRKMQITNYRPWPGLILSNLPSYSRRKDIVPFTLASQSQNCKVIIINNSGQFHHQYISRYIFPKNIMKFRDKMSDLNMLSMQLLGKILNNRIIHHLNQIWTLLQRYISC